MNIVLDNLLLRTIMSEDLEELWQAAYKNPEAAWMKYKDPYFNEESPEHDFFLKTEGPQNFLDQPGRWLIIQCDSIIGRVTFYFEDGPLRRGLEVGIVIYNEKNWNQGIASKVLSAWLEHLFSKVTPLPHIGLTTWSGNQGMMRVSEKIGMKSEGRIRQVRYWQDQYGNSVKYGILRSEWEELKKAEDLGKRNE